MSIPKGCTSNFDTMCQAVRAGDVCLMECTDKVTGRPVNVVCATNFIAETREVMMVPIAKLFDGNPYEELIPPDHTR